MMTCPVIPFPASLAASRPTRRFSVFYHFLIILGFVVSTLANRRCQQVDFSDNDFFLLLSNVSLRALVYQLFVSGSFRASRRHWLVKVFGGTVLRGQNSRGFDYSYFLVNLFYFRSAYETHWKLGRASHEADLDLGGRFQARQLHGADNLHEELVNSEIFKCHDELSFEVTFGLLLHQFTFKAKSHRHPVIILFLLDRLLRHERTNLLSLVVGVAPQLAVARCPELLELLHLLRTQGLLLLLGEACGVGSITSFIVFIFVRRLRARHVMIWKVWVRLRIWVGVQAWAIIGHIAKAAVLNWALLARWLLLRQLSMVSCDDFGGRVRNSVGFWQISHFS